MNEGRQTQEVVCDRELLASGDAKAERSGYLSQHIQSLDRLGSKLEQANEGLHGLADRLLGATPPDDKDKAALEPCPDGVMGQCQARDNCLHDKVDHVLFALERLQQIA